MTDANTFSFLLTTDNHLGFMEKDPRRGPDSFVTFEECLRAARITHNVDAILLGGDLFHYNKPSLSTLTKTMNLFKKYTLGDKPIEFSILSDPSINFPTHSYPLANFQDPNINVALPVFTIYGNHDDPIGGTSAIDVLSTAGLVNFFGHVDTPEDIVLRPILLQKGTTKVAIYGMGNVRDERLYRCFKLEKVRFVKPLKRKKRDNNNNNNNKKARVERNVIETSDGVSLDYDDHSPLDDSAQEEEEDSDWFNILILHQNRGLRTQDSKSGIEESMLKGFGIDLVIWGNEHEQLMTPFTSEGFDIVQPGSTVLTSLGQGESTNPKKYGLLEVRGNQYRVTPYLLKSIRPVVRRTVVLWRDNPSGRSLDTVEEYLKTVADGMIEEAEEQILNIPQDVLEFHPNLKFPLMRLAVDYHDNDGRTTFPLPNVNRFGQQFLDVVVNAGEILKPIKPKKKTQTSGNGNNNNRPDFDNVVVPSSLSTTDIRVKIAEVLNNTSRDACQLLSEAELGNAVYQFVEKSEKGFIETKIEELLLSSQKYTWKRISAIMGGDNNNNINNNNNNNNPMSNNAAVMISKGNLREKIHEMAFENKKEVNKQFQIENCVGDDICISVDNNNNTNNGESDNPETLRSAAAVALAHVNSVMNKTQKHDMVHDNNNINNNNINNNNNNLHIPDMMESEMYTSTSGVGNIIGASRNTSDVQAVGTKRPRAKTSRKTNNNSSNNNNLNKNINNINSPPCLSLVTEPSEEDDILLKWRS